MITISACMIVKNEEKFLERCLSCLTGIVDEIIIVDTGSVDKTKEIARRFTDKVYDYSWENDFAKARNFSFSKATKDYIYVADADEVIDVENQNKFRLLKAALIPDIEIVQMWYGNQLEFGTTYNYDREYRPKLYKRVRTFQWEDQIHESVRVDPVIYDSDILIEHRPEESHGDRDFATFIKLIARGEEISDKLHTMYAKELFIVGKDSDFIEALPFFENSIKMGGRGTDAVMEAICVLSKAYRLQRNLEGLFCVCVKGAANQPPSELCYEIGEYFFEKGELLEAILWYENAAYETSSILNIKYQNEYPLVRLEKCYLELNQVEEAQKVRDILDGKVSQ